MMRHFVLAISGIVLAQVASAAVVDFEDLTLAAESAAPADASQTAFSSGGLTFNRTWNTEFDCCPSAWAYSNQTDLATAGFGNPYSAYVLPAGGGVSDSSNFAVANNGQPGDAEIVFPAPSQVQGTYVANSTYSYLAVVDGNDGGAGFVKGPFGDGDWFRLDFVGLDGQGQELGTVEFFLADYRNGQSAAVSDWTWVDLAALGDEVKSLEFRMASSDTGDFGMNTPAYFAIDNLTYQIVPEPAGLACTLLSLPPFPSSAHSWSTSRADTRWSVEVIATSGYSGIHT